MVVVPIMAFQWLYIDIVQGTINIKRNILQYWDYFSVISYKLSTRYQLSNDIEKNPGPSILYVDPSKQYKHHIVKQMLL